jgi:hypothetical protein
MALSTLEQRIANGFAQAYTSSSTGLVIVIVIDADRQARYFSFDAGANTLYELHYVGRNTYFNPHNDTSGELAYDQGLRVDGENLICTGVARFEKPPTCICAADSYTSLHLFKTGNGELIYLSLLNRFPHTRMGTGPMRLFVQDATGEFTKYIPRSSGLMTLGDTYHTEAGELKCTVELVPIADGDSRRTTVSRWTWRNQPLEQLQISDYEIVEDANDVLIIPV